MLVNIKVIRSHVHIAHSNQRCAHVESDGTTLIRMIIFIIIAYIADIGGRPCRCLQVLDTLAEFAGIGRLLLWLTLMGQIRLIIV